MLPTSKRQLVVFAVVLILPALRSGGFLSGTLVHQDCMDMLVQCGEIMCRLVGSGGLRDYDPNFCRLECAGSAMPSVPDGVCRGDVRNCTKSVRESLDNWHHTLQRTLNGVLEEWCTCFPKE
uniref:Putative secreted WC salivary protein n=1 Tax=Ixodes scapularis TaxID=6945 RepID=Q4PN95_IXOSC|nr:putative secreted WC salivary protein [Ixodes scapularis]